MQWFSARDRSTNLPAAYSCDEHRRGSLTRAWWKIRSRKVAQNHMKTFKVTSIWMDARSPSESFRVRSTGSPAHTERAETRALRCRFRIVQRTSLNGEFFGFFFFKITLFVHHQLQFSRTYRIFFVFSFLLLLFLKMVECFCVDFFSFSFSFTNRHNIHTIGWNRSQLSTGHSATQNRPEIQTNNRSLPW